MDPVLEYRGLSMAAFQVRGYQHLHYKFEVEFQFAGTRVQGVHVLTNFQHEPLFGAATHYCIYLNVFKVFFFRAYCDHLLAE